MANYDEILIQVIGACDLSTELGRRQAVARCTEYATAHLQDSLEWHTFMKAVSHRIRPHIDPARNGI